VERYDGVVLVDSDDILHPSRIASARIALQELDLSGCALRLVDEKGRDLGQTFRLPRGTEPERVLPRCNVFGLSNTAFRSVLLNRCLPIPDQTVLVDWFLATRAWLCGARMGFDAIPRMDYRQHSTNMVRFRPPFSIQQVMKDSYRVLHHFQTVRSVTLEGAIPELLAVLKQTEADITVFYRKIVLQPHLLEQYVHALNALSLEPLWWSSIANPALQHMWSEKKGDEQ
jgi:hypothetical protein